jgi:large subunit ribosomal protein L24
VSLTSQGRSAAALVGALSGAGSVTLKDARIASLDPAAFESAVRASDDGKPVDDVNLRPMIDPVLTAGSLSLPAAQIPFSLRDGRLRVGPTPIQAPRAQLTLSGGYDIAADQSDIRAILSANVIKPETGRPDIRVDLNGPPGAMARTLDVASLSSWLAMRAIDRETRKLDQLERGVTPLPERELQPAALENDSPDAEPLPRSEVKIPNRDPRRKSSGAKAAVPNTVAQPAPSSAQSQVQPLPPPVTVRPAPGAPKQQQKAKPPMVLTP